MTERGHVQLADSVALVGEEGWFDASLGKPELLRYTFEWFLVRDFLRMNGMNDRIEAWRTMARAAATSIEKKLNSAVEDNHTVYVMTHFPPWKEATCAVGTWLQNYSLPYDTNVVMGAAIERVAANYPDKRIIVLAGHTHIPCRIQVKHNLECIVARATYWGRVRPEQTIIL